MKLEINKDYELDIWMKFSNYLTEEEVSFINGFNKRSLSEISESDIDNYLRIKRQLEFSYLLKKYKDKTCTKKEHDFVSEFMNTSLKQFVESKISEEEKTNAKEYVSLLFENNELEQYIKVQEVSFQSSSIFDAYILFIAKEKINNELNKETNKNLRKSLI